MAVKTPQPLSILAVGAHVDDHWYGMGGTLLKAARKGHRVTVIQAVSNYCAWPVVAGREAEIKPHVKRITDETGVQVVTLGHDYLRLVNGPDLSRQLAEQIAIIEPDLLFCPWEEDSNQDHAALGTAARVTALHGACFLPTSSPLNPRGRFYSMRWISMHVRSGRMRTSIRAMSSSICCRRTTSSTNSTPGTPPGPMRSNA
jgi:hypothetical protein